MFVDYAGPTIPIIDALTGEITKAQIFVAVLGASNYTFALATSTQKTQDWLLGHRKAFEYFGGVTQVVVPDNPKSLIANPDRYEPQVGRSYAEFAAHYGCAVIPARPRKPQDKGKVEVAVQVVERWILARLRHQQFFSLGDLNKAIADLLEELNTHPFKKLSGNRKSAFERLIEAHLNHYPPNRLRCVLGKKPPLALTTMWSLSVTITAYRLNICAKQSSCVIPPTS